MQLPVNTPTDVKIVIQRLENSQHSTSDTNIVRTMKVDHLVLSLNRAGAALFAFTPEANNPMVFVTGFYDFSWHKTMLTPEEIEQLSEYIAQLMNVPLEIEENYENWKNADYIATAALEKVHGEPNDLRLWVNSADTAILTEYAAKNQYEVTNGFGMSYIIIPYNTLRLQKTHDDLFASRLKITEWTMKFFKLGHIIQK